MKREKIQKEIAKNILCGTFNATAWIFETLIFMADLTIESFLKPSCYADFPSFEFSESTSANAHKRKKGKFKEMTIRHSLWRLQKQGFVRKKEGKYLLAEKGRKLADYILKRKKIIDKKWDEKYRVVIFDIPEKERRFRNWLRRELYMLNYKKLQKSVFISKVPLTKDIAEEIKKKKMGNYVNYLLVEKVYKNII